MGFVLWLSAGFALEWRSCRCAPHETCRLQNAWRDAPTWRLRATRIWETVVWRRLAKIMNRQETNLPAIWLMVYWPWTSSSGSPQGLPFWFGPKHFTHYAWILSITRTEVTKHIQTHPLLEYNKTNSGENPSHTVSEGFLRPWLAT